MDKTDVTELWLKKIFKKNKNPTQKLKHKVNFNLKIRVFDFSNDAHSCPILEYFFQKVQKISNNQIQMLP